MAGFTRTRSLPWSSLWMSRISASTLAMVLAACGQNQLSTLDDNSGAERSLLTHDSTGLNRLPLALLSNEGATLSQSFGWRLPQTVVEDERTSMGLRLFRDIEEYHELTEPGDIIVSYLTTTDEEDVISVAMHGMSHAAILVRAADLASIPGLDPSILSDRDDDSCHVDSPSYLSECEVSNQTHVFRPRGTPEERRRSAEIALERLRRIADVSKRTSNDIVVLSGDYYDSRLYTDILVMNGLERVKKKWDEELLLMYCSELVLTTQSMASNRLLGLQGLYPDQILEEARAIGEKVWSRPYTDDEVREYLLAFIGGAEALDQAEAQSKQRVLDFVASQYLREGLVGRVSRALINHAAMTPIVMPNAVMVEAKKDTMDKDVYYIGTMLYQRETTTSD